MFIAEARLASRLNHANVVQIFDFDKHEDTYYLAMEYVRGALALGAAPALPGADDRPARRRWWRRSASRSRAGCTTPTG